MRAIRRSATEGEQPQLEVAQQPAHICLPATQQPADIATKTSAHNRSTLALLPVTATYQALTDDFSDDAPAKLSPTEVAALMVRLAARMSGASSSSESPQ